MRIRPSASALVAAVLVWGAPAPAFASECTHADRSGGQCTTVGGSVGAGGVSIYGTQIQPGTGGTSGGSWNRWTPPPPRDPVLGSANCEVKIAGLCRGLSPSKESSEPQDPTPPQTLSDVAQFAPGSPNFVLEPAGWSLPHLPMNIYSTAGATTEMGELLGWPIEVTFTPVSYYWSYGDGTARSTTNAGASWGARQFSTTTTSHTYQSSGVYTVSLSITYRASYRFGGGAWVVLPGELTRTAGSRTVDVLSVTPLLVNKGCQSESLVAGRC